MRTSFEDDTWTFRAWGRGNCVEVVLDVLTTYPRGNDSVTVSGVAAPDDPANNFCTLGIRRFHGTARILGGSGNYADATGQLSFTGILTGDGPGTRESVRIDWVGSLRCYHVGSPADRSHGR